MRVAARLGLLLLLSFLAFPRASLAAGTANKTYNLSCDTGTTANAPLYNFTVGTQFKVRCKVIDQATGAGITGLTNTQLIFQQVKNVSTNVVLTAGTNYTAGTFAAVGGGVYDWPITISSGVASGNIVEFQMRETTGTEIDGQRITAVVYARTTTAGVAGNAHNVEVQPSTNGDITAASGNYAFSVKFFDATGAAYNPGAMTWALNRWRDSATVTETATVNCTWNAGGYYACTLTAYSALTTGNRQYITVSATLGNYVFYVNMGLTAVATQTTPALAVPTYTAPSLFATNPTAAGTVTASASGCADIVVTAPYTGDANANNTLSYRYRTPSGTGAWVGPTTVAHAASPYSVTITPLITGATYEVEVTYVDADTVSGTNPQPISNIVVGATCLTTVGTVTATPSGCNGLAVSATYTGDSNLNNTLSYRYAPAGSGTWSASIALGHSASPYVFPIAGLTTGSAYDVEVTYADGDTVSGTNPQTVSNVTVGASCTVAGTVTVGQAAGATPSLLVSAPYTVDGNANNTASYRTRTPTGTGTWTAAAPVAHSATPYAVTVSGLTCGGSYDVEWTFLDGDGIGGGTAVQTVSNVSPTNCTTAGAPSGVVNSCTSITVNAPFTFDGNANGSAAFSSGPSATGPWTPVAGCGVVTGPSPRSCTDGSRSASSTTYYQVTFSDADGLSGTNPAVTAGLTTPTCSNPPVIPGVPTVAAASCTSLTVSAPFTGDTNTNSVTTVSYGPTAAGPWTTACSGLAGVSPRACSVSGLSNATAYHVQVVFTDPDGVTGAATQVVGPTSTNDCRVAPGTVSATVNSCSQITASATHTGDSNGTSTSAFARGPTSSGPWTTVCGSVGGASPRKCVDLGVTALSTWFYQVTYTDPDTVNGANPIVTASSVTTPTCFDFLTVSSGTGQPPLGNVAQGSTGTVVGKLLLSSSASGSVTLSTLKLTNLGSALSGVDVQGLLLWDDLNTNGAVDVGEPLLASAAYASGQYVFSGLTHVVTAPTNRQVLVTLNVAAGATATRTFQLQVAQADVVVVAPDTVAATNFPLSGNVFTVTAGTWSEGDPTANSQRPVAVILNPTNGATVSSDGPAGTTGFRVQAQIYSPSALLSVTLSTDNGATFLTTLAQNANYGGTATDGIWETAVKLNPGAAVLVVRATNAAGAVDTGKVQVVVNAKGVGDGNLLVRDNSSQLCLDCHALQTHSSQATGNKYGSWAVSCRDCHAPHGTTNIFLVRNQITPPAVNGPQAAKAVKFSTATGANASTLATAQSFANETDHSGPCQVCHTRTQGPGAVARWRNTGNADTHYTSTNGTAPCTDCHPHAGGFKPMSCLGCHGTTGAETTDLGDAFWSNGIKTTFNTDEWTWSGHGKTAGTYDVTLNPAANLPTAPSPGASECLYCHDDSIAHKTATNPFRLRGASNLSGVTAAYSTASPNDTCLNCHNTGSNGVTPGGQLAKNGTVKTDTAHDGAKHTVGSLGGKFCWDCHDPHGDRTSLGVGNTTMIRNSVLAVTDGTYGYLGLTGQARAVTYNTKAASPPAVGKTVETTTAAGTQHVGLCQACHGDTSETNWTKYWNRQGYDDPNGPPNTDRVASAHNSTSATTPYCVSCHPHALKFKGQGTCVDCHNGPQPITMGPLAGVGTRRAIVPEFALAWSHKRNATPAGTVTKWDCVVCHMEGDPATGDTSAVHANGVIDLRDPDTGTTIEGVTFGGTGAGAYTSTAGVTATPAQFSRNLGSATIEPDVAAIMMNQCLKCHDNNGAVSTAARVPTTGTAEKPFGTTIAGAAYTGLGVTANGVLGGVVDVNESFKVTNSSYHPVAGKQNNWYAKLTRMAAPWNTATRGATVDTASWGPLITCFDCHSPVGATGIQTATVTAHGAAATLRGSPTVIGTPSAANSVTLCAVCHAGYLGGTANNHGANSAFTQNTDNGMTSYVNFGCNICHSSGYTTAVVRPVRAQDVHGVNVLPTGGLAKTLRWAGVAQGTPALVDARPFAFIRNTQVLPNHTPKQNGTTVYTTNCMGGNVAPCSQGQQGYTIGGTY